MPTLRERGWLVEREGPRGRPFYLTVNAVVGWVEDPDRAIRFARQCDGEAFAAFVYGLARSAEITRCRNTPGPMANGCIPNDVRTVAAGGNGVEPVARAIPRWPGASDLRPLDGVPLLAAGPGARGRGAG